MKRGSTYVPLEQRKRIARCEAGVVRAARRLRGACYYKDWEAEVERVCRAVDRLERARAVKVKE